MKRDLVSTHFELIKNIGENSAVNFPKSSYDNIIWLQTVWLSEILLTSKSCKNDSVKFEGKYRLPDSQETGVNSKFT
jgi:hypothetical protein